MICVIIHSNRFCVMLSVFVRDKTIISIYHNIAIVY